MIAAKSLVVRTGFELSTPKLAEITAGTTVEVLEMRQLPDYTTRALVAIHNGPRGWLTMTTPKDRAMHLVEPSGSSSARAGPNSGRQGSARDGEATQPTSGGRENARSPHTVRIAPGTTGGGGGSSKAEPPSAAGAAAANSAVRVMPTYVISSPKPLLARTEFDLQSGRVGELVPGTRIHVLESRPLPDGGKRVRLSLESSPGNTYGWVTAITKSGQENLAPFLFEVIASKPLLVRKDFDVKSEKLGEIAPGAPAASQAACLTLRLRFRCRAGGPPCSLSPDAVGRDLRAARLQARSSSSSTIGRPLMAHGGLTLRSRRPPAA